MDRMDDFDHATAVEEQFRALAVAAATRPIAARTLVSATHCQNEACGEEIPEARRNAAPGCRFCVDCQERCETTLRRRLRCR